MKTGDVLIGFLAGMIGATFGTAHIYAAENQKPWYYELKPETQIIAVNMEDMTDTPEQIEEEIYDGELALLAALVHAEAENQTFMGKCLVVDTVLNRVDSSEFPNNISDVIYQNWQFSSVKDGRLELSFMKVTDEDYNAVISELNHRKDYEVMYFRTERYSDYGIPLYKYGDHFFSK